MSRWHVVVRFIRHLYLNFSQRYFWRLTILFLMYVDTDNDTEVLFFNIYLRTLYPIDANKIFCEKLMYQVLQKVLNVC
jgi:hypothetical protein